MTEFMVVQIIAPQPEKDDGFRDIQRIMLRGEINAARRIQKQRQRRARIARRNRERKRIFRKLKLWAILGAVICAQIGALLAVTLWRG